MKFPSKSTMAGLLLLILVCVGLSFAPVSDSIKQPDSITVVCDPGSKLTHDTLAKWVYTHSNKISMTTCNEIVFEVMKSDKPLLLLALVEVESNLMPSAISPRGALGLTQVMPGVWEKDLIAKGIIKERRDLFDVGPSIAAGDYALGVFIKESKGNVEKALEKYLGGRDGVYVKRIFANLANLYIVVGEIK